MIWASMCLDKQQEAILSCEMPCLGNSKPAVMLLKWIVIEMKEL